MGTLKLKLIIVCFMLSISICTRLSGSDLNPMIKHFFHKGEQYVLSVEHSIGRAGCHVFLTSGKTQKNLSLDFTGENLFPNVQVHGDHFYVTWILSKKHQQQHSHQQRDQQHVYACYYDSYSDTSHGIPRDRTGFHFLSNPYLVFRGSHPRALVFLGKRLDNDNDEVFAYDLKTDRVINVTQTPENEKVFSIIEEHGGFSLRTETIPFFAVYTVRFPGLEVVNVEKQKKEIKAPEIPTTIKAAAYNTIVGFGDSIIYGKMRMVDLPGEYHPELAFLSLIQNTLTGNYGPVDQINLGVPRDTTFKAAERLHDDFTGLEAYFCLIMLGTNDVAQNSFSASSSEETLRWICLQIRDTYGMYPIISTIPPIKYYLPGVQFLQSNTEDLNERIKSMAEETNIPCVDTYTAFLEQPDWEAMLEDIMDEREAAVHPSPAGHEVIANLFLPKILELTPQMPSNIQTFSITPYRRTVEWTENIEFDFSHYTIEFGYHPLSLTRKITTNTSFYTFIIFPSYTQFYSKLYYRIQASDLDGNTSGFTSIQEIELK